jgi:hypothetical protein
MTAAVSIAPVAGKVAKLVRLLSSDRDGEVLGAVEGLKRTLASINCDLHTVADLILSAAAPGADRSPNRPDNDADLLDALAALWLTPAEDRFVAGCFEYFERRKRLSPRQREVLIEIFERAQAQPSRAA